MLNVLLRRLFSAVPVLAIVSLITFGMIHMIPGDPAAAIAGMSATPDQIAAIRSDLGLDQPVLDHSCTGTPTWRAAIWGGRCFWAFRY